MAADCKINIKIPGAVNEILNRLHNNGYEAYIVGGCVRDALLKREAKDWDITTSALPHEVKALFNNTVDTGIQHGTVMVIKGGEGYEVTTYRVDGEYKDGRHPSSVTFTASLAEDLKRRDFTINAFAWDEEGLIDLFDGLSDLKNGIIRCVGNPNERFNEDALRIMRAVRFSAQLGFEIEAETRNMIGKYKERLKDVSRERIRVEFEKTLISDNPSVVNLYGELGLAEYIIDKASFRCFDGSSDSLLEEILKRKGQTACEAPSGLMRYAGDPEEFYRLLSMAAFLHKLTPEEADKSFKSLKYDNRTREAVVKIIRHMNRVFTDDRAELKRALNELGPETVIQVLELQDIFLTVKDSACEDGDVKTAAGINKALNCRICDEIQDILDRNEPWCTAHLAVNGKDLIARGIPAGKKIGLILEKILQKVISEPTLNNKETLLEEEFLNKLSEDD